MSGIAGGAEVVSVPEFEAKPQEIMRAFRKSWEQHKPHFIMVVAEGASVSAEGIHRYINSTDGAFESRLTVLGHVQRGGSPTAFDRLLASRMGTAAVEALSEGQSGIMIGLGGRQTGYIPLNEVVGRARQLDADIYGMAEVLAGFPEEISYL
jgi:6-phosphofructokinase 1